MTPLIEHFLVEVGALRCVPAARRWLDSANQPVVQVGVVGSDWPQTGYSLDRSWRVFLYQVDPAVLWAALQKIAALRFRLQLAMYSSESRSRVARRHLHAMHHVAQPVALWQRGQHSLAMLVVVRLIVALILDHAAPALCAAPATQY